MRKELILPEQDLDYLTSLGLLWETFKEGNSMWLLIYDFPVPEGYNLSKVNVLLMIHPSYPVAQIDMAYFFPHLQLLKQKTIGALTFQNIDKKIFQRWSRHRTGTNPWRAGVDDLSTHLALVSYWLQREL